MRQDPRTRGEGAGRPASEGARKGACGPARDLGRGSPPPPPRPHPDRRTPQAPLLGPGASGPCVRVSARPQPRVAPAWRSPFLRAVATPLAPRHARAFVSQRGGSPAPALPSERGPRPPRSKPRRVPCFSLTRGCMPRPASDEHPFTQFLFFPADVGLLFPSAPEASLSAPLDGPHLCAFPFDPEEQRPLW